MKRSATSFTVRVGIAKIRIWENSTQRKDGRRYQSWEFEYKDENGQRRRCNRADKETARAEARAIAGKIAEGAGAAWSAEETAAFRAVKTNLFGCNVTPEVATWQYRKARERLATIGRESIEEAVEFFVTHHHGGICDKTIDQVIEELLQVRKRDGANWRHLKDLKSHLERFSREVKCRLQDVTALVVDRWLSELPKAEGKGRVGDVGNRTRMNYRASLSNFFRFAQERGYVPKNFDPIKSVKVPKVAKPKRGVLRPEELTRLLASCRDTLRPVLAVGSFAGLRQSEVLLLDWGDIDWQENRIRVPEEGKTGGRLAPLHPNLRAWLEPIRRRHGRIVSITQSGVSNGIKAAVAKANKKLAAEASRWRITWPHNAPRHSYASYRCALTRNVGLVADEMGHSISELRRSYRNQKVTPEEAEAWFAILPGKAANVLEFDFSNDGPRAVRPGKSGEKSCTDTPSTGVSAVTNSRLDADQKRLL